MKMIKKYIIPCYMLILLIFCPLPRVMAENSYTQSGYHYQECIEKNCKKLQDQCDNQLLWGDNDSDYSFEIVNILEYLKRGLKKDEFLSTNSCINKIIEEENIILLNVDINNTDNLSHYLLMDNYHYIDEISNLLKLQNNDGGYGLSDGYASDIIDTKLALKALIDCGETDAATKAALYLSSLQNDDGGFSYQKGLHSDLLLSSEIADILVDAIALNPDIAGSLSATLSSLEGYLDSNVLPVSELSTDDMDMVYANFHTALFKLNKDGRYDVSPYYSIQAEDGGVFDDPYATALFLELIVREEDSCPARIDDVSVTNEKGYAVSSFGADQDVRISVACDFAAEKAHLDVSIIKPDGTVETLDPAISEGAESGTRDFVWDTAENLEGSYTVRAEIIHDSNEETLASMERLFDIRHILSVDRMALSLSQPYSMTGDKDTVDVSAEIDLRGFDEDEGLKIHWGVYEDKDNAPAGGSEPEGF